MFEDCRGPGEWEMDDWVIPGGNIELTLMEWLGNSPITIAVNPFLSDTKSWWIGDL